MEVKERMSIPRQGAKELPIAVRIRNFDEVTYGYAAETAQLEAERCLRCRAL